MGDPLPGFSGVKVPTGLRVMCRGALGASDGTRVILQRDVVDCRVSARFCRARERITLQGDVADARLGCCSRQVPKLCRGGGPGPQVDEVALARVTGPSVTMLGFLEGGFGLPVPPRCPAGLRGLVAVACDGPVGPCGLLGQRSQGGTRLPP